MAKKGLGNGLDTMLGVNTSQTRKSKKSEPVETKEVIKEVVKEVVKEVFVHSEIEKYMVEIVAQTRKRDKLIIGVSPRGTLALMRAVKAYAALMGRSYCIPDDVKALAVPVLAHRIKVNYGYQAEGGAENVIREILDSVQAPTEN